MAYFVVVNEQGPAWVTSQAMRDQPLWNEHAAFINSGMYSRRVVLGGPLGEGSPHRALLILNMESESAARTWLAEDPWVREGLLRTRSIELWKILVSNDQLDPVLAEITRSTGGA